MIVGSGHIAMRRCSRVVRQLMLGHSVMSCCRVVVGRSSHCRLVEMVGSLGPIRRGFQLGVIVTQVQRRRDLGHTVGGKLGEVIDGQLGVVCESERERERVRFEDIEREINESSP